MEWIKSIIEETEQLSKLKLYLEDLDSSETNYNKLVDGSKALIESICKTILTDLGVEVEGSIKLPALMKETLKNMPFFINLERNDQDNSRKIIGSMINISQSFANIRNIHGYMSHGKDVGEDFIESSLSKLCVKSANVVGGFLLETHLNFTPLEKRSRLNYDDHSEFNESFDSQFDENVKVGTLEFLPSEVLFNNDFNAYKTELLDFTAKSQVEAPQDETNS